MYFPIESFKDEIVRTIAFNRATIIVGETGSGKTTQVPPYLYNAGFAKEGRIGVCEPRRIAAISACDFVARQLGVRVGEEVGYQIRFNDSTTEGTKVKFMTDGILLQEAKSDPTFSRYDVLVFDEAHERGINSDFCLGLAKRALTLRDDLKVVVMSATIDFEKFSAFFGGAPVIQVQGRMFPVETRYFGEEDRTGALALLAPKGGQEVEAYAAYIVEKIHRSHLPGDILVFMPGEAEIHRVIRHIEFLGLQGVKTLAVYGNMSPDEQRRIFDKVSARKVVVATNIAETSLTIEGVIHVVDSGLIKQSDFNPESGIGTLKVVEHSKMGLEQRKGRAGRTQPGIYWPLFTEEEYKRGRLDFCQDGEGRPEHTKPEIQRSDLASIVLRLVGIGAKDVEKFDFIDAPSADRLQAAVETLQAIGALTSQRDITEVGEKLLDLPLDPKIARMILEAQKFGCVKEAVGISAKLSVRDLFMRPKDEDERFKADAAKRRFVDVRSDLLTALEVMRQYEESGWNRTWARENFLNWKAIEEAFSIRRQVEEILEKLGIELTSVGYRLPKDQFDLTDEEKSQGEKIGKAVTAGFIQNLARAAARHAYERLGGKDGCVYVHPGSGLFNRFSPLNFMVSISVVETTKPYARDCQEVEFGWLEEVALQAIKKEVSAPEKSWVFGGYRVYERLYFNGILISENSREVPAPAQTVKPQVMPAVERTAFQPQSETPPQPQESSRLVGLKRRIDAVALKIDMILRDPEKYGYEGGYGLTRKTYQISHKIDSVRDSFYSRSDDAENLLFLLESEVNNAFKRAAETEEKRQEKAEKKAAEEAEARMLRAAKERKSREKESYLERLKMLRAQYGQYSGFGIYTFPIGPDGMPQDYRGEDGTMLSFDEDFFEVLPEKKAPHWGYVTQWGNPTKVALLMEAMPELEEKKGEKILR